MVLKSALNDNLVKINERVDKLVADLLYQLWDQTALGPGINPTIPGTDPARQITKNDIGWGESLERTQQAYSVYPMMMPRDISFRDAPAAYYNFNTRVAIMISVRDPDNITYSPALTTIVNHIEDIIAENKLTLQDEGVPTIRLLHDEYETNRQIEDVSRAVVIVGCEITQVNDV